MSCTRSRMPAYKRVCLVIGPDHHELRRYYGQELQLSRLTISFAVQQTPRGTADAVAAAEPFTGTDSFISAEFRQLLPHRRVSFIAINFRRRAGGL